MCMCEEARLSHGQEGLGTLGEHRRTKAVWGCVGRKVAGTTGFLAEERLVRLLWKQGHRGQGQVTGGSPGSCHNMTHLVQGGRNGRAEKWGILCHNRNHMGNCHVLLVPVQGGLWE